MNGVEKTFTILGSTESNPPAGIISYQSPVGAALLGKKVGDTVKIKTGAGEVHYTVSAIYSLTNPHVPA